MAGYTRVDTSNNIADGNVISAADLDNEFDGIQAAFNASTGHNHDGTTGEGAPILVLGPTQDVVVGASTVTPKTTNTVDIGSSSLKFKDLYMAGNASIGGTLAVTGVATLTAQPILSSLTASRAVFTDGSKGLVSNAITGTGNVVMSASPTLTGTITAEALTTSSTVTLNGGTANGIAYLNGSKVLTSGSALTFDGNGLSIGTGAAQSVSTINGGTTGGAIKGQRAGVNQWFFGDTAAALGSGTGLISFLYNNDPFIWYSNSAEQMRLTSTGLGIGTSSPAYKLDVNGGDIRITDTFPSLVLNGTTGGVVWNFIEVASGNLETRANDITRLSLTSSGNLGLGVTPSAWGGVLGSAMYETRNAMHFGSINSTSSIGYIGVNAYYDGTNWVYKNSSQESCRYELNSNSTGAHAWFTAPSGTAGNAISFTQAMTLDASGKLLVGTTTAEDFRLAVRGSGMGGILATAPSGYNGIAHLFGINGVSNGYQINCTSGNAISHVWSIGGGAEAARIDSSGNLLVGTTGIEGVGGFTIRPNLGGAGSFCRLTLNANGTNDVFNFLQNGTQVGRIQIAATQVFYVTTSDYRLKENVQSMHGALEKVLALNPVTYTWKATGETDQGFIAHELAEVCPQAVSGEKDAVNEDGSINPQGIDTSFLVATLTAAIQEQQAMIDTLKARLDAANL